MKRLLTGLLLSLALCPVFASAQGSYGTFRPFVQVTAEYPINMGYNRPFPVVQPGFEYWRNNFYTESTADMGFFVHKDRQGAGFDIGGTSRYYYMVSRRTSLGGGIQYGYLSTPTFAKDALRADFGSIFWLNTSRVYLDYKQPIKDQNSVHALQLTGVAGSRRFQPFAILGIDHYVEPSYCHVQCNGFFGFYVQGGLRILLNR